METLLPQGLVFDASIREDSHLWNVTAHQAEQRRGESIDEEELAFRLMLRSLDI